MTIRLFGYGISIGKVPKHKPRLTGPMCKLSHDNGFLFLTDPDGYALPKQVSIKIVESLYEPPRAIVELFIDTTIVEHVSWSDKTKTDANSTENTAP